MAVGANARMGYGGILGFGNETAFGVTATTIDKFMEFKSANFTKTLGGKVLESLGTGRSKGRRVTTQIDVEGTLSWNLHPSDGLLLLKHAMMGSVVSLGLSTPVYAHTFTAGNLSNIANKGITFNFKPADTVDSFIIIGARINSLKISGETGGDAITAEIGIIAKGMTAGTFVTSGSVAFSPAKPFQPQDVTISIDGASEDIISFELTCPENNLQNDGNARSLGSKTLTVLPPKERNLGLTLTQRYDTLTAWNRHKDASAMAIIITMDTGETIGASASFTFKLQCDLPKVYYDSGGPPEVSDSGILTHELSIVPVLDTLTGGKDIVFSAWNTTSNYGV